MKYQKKPEVIEAIRLPMGEDAKDEFVLWAERVGFVPLASAQNGTLKIKTATGVMKAQPGDWIIKDEKGFSSCKPDVFAETYEPIAVPAAKPEPVKLESAGAKA
jgi:hypothetical protein